MTNTITIMASRNYLTYYFIFGLIINIALLMAFIGLVTLPIFLLKFFRVYKRTSWKTQEKGLYVTVGRIFVLDEELIPYKSIDNVKLDNSLIGNLFGYTNLVIDTRSGRFILSYAEKTDAKEFRDFVLTQM